jgi:methionine biosynthesis protein metW
MDEYKQVLKSDIELAKKYYLSSIKKTEQQKMLESLLVSDKKFEQSRDIADIACGGGTLSFHLANINEIAKFTLVDYLEESLEVSREVNHKFSDRFFFFKDDIYDLHFPDNSFDIVFCWQTLFCLENPLQALDELLRIVKKGGRIYLSSLFNLDHDVDIYSKLYDYTRDSGKNGLCINYNTYSQKTINNWLFGKVAKYKIYPFSTSIPFEYSGRGIGTYTKKCENEFIQISGGLLMNWGILEIEK